MSFEELALEHYFSPQDKLEFAEFQKLTNKFRKFCLEREQKNLTNEEIFELISDNPFYQSAYKRIISEDNTREALKIFLATNLSILEDKKTMQLAKSWRIL